MNELTKQMLNDWKIKVELSNEAKTGYKFYHYGQIPGTARFDWKEITPTLNWVYHPKSKNSKQYYIVSWSDYANTKRGITIPLHRLVYVWFIADAPKGYDISHKNDDSFDNRLDNLECITHRENLAKRKCKWANQYGKGVE